MPEVHAEHDSQVALKQTLVGLEDFGNKVNPYTLDRIKRTTCSTFSRKSLLCILEEKMRFIKEEDQFWFSDPQPLEVFFCETRQHPNQKRLKQFW